MNSLPEHVEQSIRAHRLARRGGRILAAVSGGLDSMVLLHVLHSLARRHLWKLTAAHFNHLLRGRSSDADERLVIRTARKLGLKIFTKRTDVKQFAKANKVSIEMAARKLRHDFLAETARRLKIRTVAVAHHADDQVELFFLRLFRGAGSEGLGGMKWRNPSPSDPGIELIRPLLDQPKRSLRQFALEAGIAHREDATNTSLDFQRNRIRHELLPLVRRYYQPALDRTVSRLMAIAGAEADLAREQAVAWLCNKRRRSFAELPVAVQRRCTQFQLLGRGVPADFELIERLRNLPGKRVQLSPELIVFRKPDGTLCFEQLKHGRKTKGGGHTVGPAQSLNLGMDGAGGRSEFGGLRLDWSLRRGRPGVTHRGVAGREHFDADRVGARVILRHWRPGDRFQPCGMASTVKLQDLFTNLKIPRAERHTLVVATTSGGELFWVEKLRISERFKLTEETNRCLQWRWKRL